MELRQMHHFVALAEELHFTRAATRVHIVQSALSTSIGTLERELGTRLFSRSARQVQLTEAGAAFLVGARRTLAAAGEARDAVASVEGVLSGTLTMGYMPAPDSYGLAEILSRFHRRHPGVNLRLRNVPSAELVEEVRTHALDLAFVSSPSQPPRNVLVDTLLQSTMPLACSVDHRLAQKSVVTLGEVAAEDFIDFVDGWGARVATDQLFASHGLERTTAFEVNDVALAVRLVEQGLGVAFLPPEAMEESRQLSQLNTDPAPQWHVGVAHLERRQMSPAARAMLDLVSTTARSRQDP